MTLSSKLWLFSKKIVKKANDHKKSEKMVIQKNPYIKSTVDSFNYVKGSINYGKSFHEIVKDTWAIKNYYDFVEQVIKPHKEYKDIIQHISKTYKVNENQANNWLTKFIQSLIFQLQETSSEEDLIDKIGNFINDLNKGPFLWQSKTWIKGIWLTEDEYQLSEDLKIRRPQKFDLEDENSTEMLIIRLPNAEPPDDASAIIEYNFRTEKQHELSEEIEAIIGCLRLFGTGSIYKTHTASSSESILNFGGRQFSNILRPIHYKYELKQTDIKSLIMIIELIKPKLIKLKNDSLNPLTIALQRYEDAILGQGIIESKITSAITCLEALFLKSEERSELSGRLSQRVGMLLDVEKFKPLEVQRELLRAYEIRSTFIHGSTLPEEERQKNKDLADKIVQYARLSLLIFITLEGKLEKSNLINKLDNSLLELKAREDLVNTLKVEYKEKIS